MFTHFVNSEGICVDNIKVVLFREKYFTCCTHRNTVYITRVLISSQSLQISDMIRGLFVDEKANHKLQRYALNTNVHYYMRRILVKPYEELSMNSS